MGTAPDRRLPGRISKAGWVAAAAVVLVAVVLALVLLHSSSSAESSLLTGSGYPNVDTSNTRFLGGPVDSATVSKLQVAWKLPLTTKSEYGSYSSAPIVSNGVIFSQDLDSNVEAIDVKTGKVIWTKIYESPDQGPNGLVVQGGRVYGETTNSAFALDEKTGKQLWSVTLVRNEHEGIDMAPGFHDGIVYVSTVPGSTTQFYKGEGVGILWALEGKTGRKLWHFDTVPEDLWSPENVSINSGGGVWYAPAFDEHGFMYIGIGNPGPFPGTNQFPWGSSRPGPDLYTDSIVKLNAATGKLMWYYQLTPHDIFDHDLEDSPILAKDNGTPIVIDGGKGGILVAVNAETGKLVWKTPVGVHNGNDNTNLEAEKGDYSKLKLPLTVEPGDLGGIESQLATDGTTVYAAVNNLAVKFKGQSDAEGEFPAGIAGGTGDLVAVNEATGAIGWDDKLPSSPYGAVTLANNVAFTTTFNGTLYAFETTTGKELWKTTLSAGTNAPVAVFGDTVVTAGSFPLAPGQKALIIAYRLGATGTLPTSTPTTTSTASTTTASAPAASGAIKIEANPTGLLKYTESSIKATEGNETVTFTNNSPLEHDVVIINSANKVLGQTPIFDHGSKSFTVKLAAGTYKYYCSVPGHREAGMEGTLTVTAAHG
jgi:outer membrane protein assembly factor BamB